MVRNYIWLDDLAVAVLDGSINPANPTLLWVHVDHLKRPELMTDASKAIVWKALYEPFGTVHQIAGPAVLDMRFPGQWFQLEAGLAYNWHRHYDASLGRYTQPDPLGLVALRSDGPSIYGYAGQSPLMRIDPEGLQGRGLLTSRPMAIPPGPVPPGYPGVGPKTPQQHLADWIWKQCLRVARALGGGPEEDCHTRYQREADRCYKESWARAHPDYTRGCLERAQTRRTMCIRNGGTPDPNEPPEWRPGPNHDEETWRNPNR